MSKRVIYPYIASIVAVASSAPYSVAHAEDDFWRQLCQLYSPPEQEQVLDSALDTEPVTIGRIEIQTHPIFDEDGDESIFIHEFANWLHYKTRESVVREQLSVSQGDTVTLNELSEAERILRNKKYLRDAKIEILSDCTSGEAVDIRVQTWDTWSLLPTLNFGRSSGENKFAIGVKDENFLGFGARASVKYQTDNQRTGYHIVLSAPLTWAPHSTGSLIVDNNDDGHLFQLVYDKPFYQIRSQTMHNLNYTDELLTENLFHNGVVENQYRSDKVAFNAEYGWLESIKALTTKRITVGVQYEQVRFDQLSGQPAIDPLLLNFTPTDYELFIPWIKWQSVSHDFAVMQDIYLTNQNEDINLGSSFGLQIGPVLNHGMDSWSAIVTLQRAFQLAEGLLLTQASVQSLINTERQDRVSANGMVEYFYSFNHDLRWYAKFAVSWQNRVFDDKPLGLGGETGLRGYPEDYQHGTNRVLLTNELRMYPRLQYYQLVDVAFVGFLDIGKASGESRTSNLDDKWLGSAGLGIRLYSSRSSNDNVVHIDLSTPLNSPVGVDSWEIGFTVRNRF